MFNYFSIQFNKVSSEAFKDYRSVLGFESDDNTLERYPGLNLVRFTRHQNLSHAELGGPSTVLYSYFLKEKPEFPGFLTVDECRSLLKQMASLIKRPLKDFALNSVVEYGLFVDTTDLEIKLTEKQIALIEKALAYRRSVRNLPTINKVEGNYTHFPPILINQVEPQNQSGTNLLLTINLNEGIKGAVRGYSIGRPTLHEIPVNLFEKQGPWQYWFGELLASLDLVKENAQMPECKYIEHLFNLLQNWFSANGLDARDFSELPKSEELPEHLFHILKRLLSISYLKFMNVIKAPGDLNYKRTISLRTKLGLDHDEIETLLADIQKKGNLEMRREYENQVRYDDRILPIDLLTKQEILETFGITEDVFAELISKGKVLFYSPKGIDHLQYYSRVEIVKGIESLFNIKFRVHPQLSKEKNMADENRKAVLERGLIN